MMSQENYSTQEMLPQELVIYKDKRAYPELQKFLEHIEASENSDIHHPYYINKKRVLLYKAIFFVFGTLFLALATIIFFKNPNWLSRFFLMDVYFVKHLVAG